MTMDWENERYVRLYTRDTPEDCLLSHEARFVWYEIIRKADRAGTIPLGRVGLDGLAAQLRAPRDVIERGLRELASDGRVRIGPSVIFVPNFMEAQEARQSDAQRKRESRAKARSKANQESLSLRSNEQNFNVTTSPVRSPLARVREAKLGKARDGRERDESNSSESKPPTEAESLAELLREKVLARDPRASFCQPATWPQTRASWLESLSTLYLTHGREWAEIREAIEWAEADSFWGPRVSSGPALLKHFDQIVQRMRVKPKPRDVTVGGYVVPANDRRFQETRVVDLRTVALS